ncbi:MarR family winged helix-turn-helix transcriptional regulator [Phaeobacter sp. B1627]|uniref:MarR family winged helix-turn-helix transcriptional regulator n=1 Tax=Phaeobacter sp. B1627 TaxID=2583809 RepID=UPI00111AB215|nr:MarR family transcriptional regulator [Phaeobacter sp. B1627]TNJ41236.1 MarR family transcriptional regulator [Phaeobacter sp. B1627]
MTRPIPEVTAPEVPSKARLRLWLKLLKTSGGIEAEVRRRLRDRHSTTLPRFDVMSALSRNPNGLKMSQLSQFLRVSNGNVTGIVDRLTGDGLALRVAVPGDRRAQVARLTPAGEAEFARLAAEHEAWIDEMMAGLAMDEINEMSALLEQIQPVAREEEQS